jgi:hypothetical protein
MSLLEAALMLRVEENPNHRTLSLRHKEYLTFLGRPVR